MVLEYWSSPSRMVQDQPPRRAVQDWFPTVTVSSGGAVSAVSGAVPQAEDGGKRKKEGIPVGHKNPPLK